MKKLVLLYVLGVVALFLSACGGGLSSKYIGSHMEMEFTSGSKALITVMSNTFEVGYEKDGKQIKLTSSNPMVNAQILTIYEQGCLNGVGDKLCKENK